MKSVKIKIRTNLLPLLCVFDYIYTFRAYFNIDSQSFSVYYLDKFRFTC